MESKYSSPEFQTPQGRARKDNVGRRMAIVAGLFVAVPVGTWLALEFMGWVA